MGRPNTRIQIACEICSTLFFAKKDRIIKKKVKYCSHKCYNLACQNKPTKRFPYTCLFCGKIKWAKKSVTKIKKYCSRFCANAARYEYPEANFWPKIKDFSSPDSCWEWSAAMTGKYGSLTIKRKHTYAHRFSWELHNGSIPDGLCILHHCDNPKCVNPTHLFLGTIKDNARDMMNKGRNNPAKGERQGNAKLTEKIVRQIRLSLIDGVTAKELSEKYNTALPNIYNIKNRKRWKHIV